MNEENKKTFYYLGAILLFGLGLRLWGINWGLPFEYQTEEYKVIKYALRMGNGDLNPHFFEYPSLYLYWTLFQYGIYFLIGKLFGWFPTAESFALQFIKDPTTFFLIGRISEALFNLSVVAMTWKLGKEVFSSKVGLAAAAVVAILPAFVYKSHMTKGDSAVCLLSLLYFYQCYKVMIHGQWKNYIWAGILIGAALSTKYTALFLIPTLLVSHFYSEQPKDGKKLITGYFLVPVAFVAGTPFSLTAEFINFWKSLFAIQTDYVSRYHMTAPVRIKLATINFLKMFDGNTHKFLGIFAIAGIFFPKAESTKKRFLHVMAITGFTSVAGVSCYVGPGAGYMEPVMPLFAIFIARLVVGVIDWKPVRLPQKLVRVGGLTFLAVGLSLTAATSFTIVRGYTLPDSRTQAREWVLKNIPPNSHILLDKPPYSPPLEMARSQLEKFAQIAQETNNYKKEYFQLKLKALPQNAEGYFIHVIARDSAEIGSLNVMVKETQKTQDLFSVEGTEQDFERLQNENVQYVIVNSFAYDSALNRIPRIARFYTMLPEHADLIYEGFPPPRHFSPKIEIYKMRNR